MTNYNFTSTDELRTRAKVEIDHVIELQILKTVLNNMDNQSFTDDQLNQIITFFNDQGNIQLLAKGENRIKGYIIGMYLTRYIENTQQDPNSPISYNHIVISKEDVDRHTARVRLQWQQTLRDKFIHKFQHTGSFATFIEKIGMVFSYEFWDNNEKD